MASLLIMISLLRYFLIISEPPGTTVEVRSGSYLFSERSLSALVYFPLVYVNKLPRYFVLSRESYEISEKVRKSLIKRAKSSFSELSIFKTNILVAPLIAIPFLDAPSPQPLPTGRQALPGGGEGKSRWRRLTVHSESDLM